MKNLALLVLCVLFLSGCSSFNMDFTPEDLADLSRIAPRADGGTSITVFDSTREPGKTFGGVFNVGLNFIKALEGNGYFGSAKLIEAQEKNGNPKVIETARVTQTEGIVIHLDNTFRSTSNGGLSFLINLASLGVVPFKESNKQITDLRIYVNGEMLTERSKENQTVIWETFWPPPYLLGQTAEITSEAYAALPATHAINEMHKLNLL